MEISFEQTIQKGKEGEDIFKKDFLEFLEINYVDVTGCQQYQIIDSDFISKIGTYEIKLNYKDNEKIVIEEYTNINERLGNVSLGWFYKTKADLLVFISKKTRVMILLPFNEKFKKFYETIKVKSKLIRNSVSRSKEGNKWQSAFRYINLDDIKGYYSKYKKP